MRKSILLGLALTACSGAPAADEDADPVADSALASLVVFVDPADLPPMPAYPAGAPGRFRVASVGEVDLSKDAEANAGICRHPSMVIFRASAPGIEEGQSWGAIMLLQVPLEGERAVLYPVAHVDIGFPVPPASMLAVQLLSGSGGVAYQAMQGFVRVSAFGERISGQFQITVREINSEDIVQLSGTFEDIEVVEIPALDCNTAAMLEG